jgi:hypothetical protein
MVTLVHWRLESAEKFNPFLRKPLPGDARRGEIVRPLERAHHNRKRGRNAVYKVTADDTDDME